MASPSVKLICGDSKKVLIQCPPDAIDACVTDPPYELGFMNRGWDANGIAFDVDFWKEVLRVLKPGAHLLAFGGTRTYHRMTCAIEDAGFEIRDCLMWMYGSGFPKSQNISIALDKDAGSQHHRGHAFNTASSHVGRNNSDGDKSLRSDYPDYVPYAAKTDLAKQWNGWGTALKPAYEPIVLARKPLVGTMVENVTSHGVGGLNIDGTRIATLDKLGGDSKPRNEVTNWRFTGGSGGSPLGRWPANVILDEEAGVLLDEQTGEVRSSGIYSANDSGNEGDRIIDFGGYNKPASQYADHGGPSRFFYCPKASTKERELGCEDLPDVRRSDGREKDIENPRLRTNTRRNHHPTIKPISLMQYLVKLVTPKAGVVLDPFLGSGTTAIAAMQEGFRVIGIDLTPEYVEIARARLQYWQAQRKPSLF